MLVLVLLGTVLAVTAAAGAQSTVDYTAATVEFVPQLIADSGKRVVSRSEALSLTVGNAKSMAAYVGKAAAQGADLVVFPEDGLYGSDFFGRDGLLPFLEEIPDTVGTVLCDPTVVSPVSVLACAAMRANVTVVADVGEVVRCGARARGTSSSSAIPPASAPCPADGRFQFNTQVAIDAGGRLAAKYHKTHLFPEDTCCFNPGTSGVVTFPLRRGKDGPLLREKIGLFICFDIFFPHPAVEAARVGGVRDFVFSTYFVNSGTDPFRITALGIVQGISRALNANIIASNVGTGAIDSGSGIFLAGGDARTIFYSGSTHDEEMLLVASIPGTTHVDNDGGDDGDNAPQGSQDRPTAIVRSNHRKGDTAAVDGIASPPSSSSSSSSSTAVVTVVPLTPGSASVVSSDGTVSCSVTFTAESADVNPATGRNEARYALIARSPSEPFLGGALTSEACAFVPCASGGDPCGNGNGNGTHAHTPFQMVGPAVFRAAELTARFPTLARDQIVIPVLNNGMDAGSVIPWRTVTLPSGVTRSTLGGIFLAHYVAVESMVLWHTVGGN